jgi:hypothetical protein
MTADDSQRYRLIGYAVMNDHVHVVVEPSMGYDLTAIVQSWKSYTTIRVLRSFGRKGRIWQREYFDRVIRDDEELRNRLAYILGNPGTRWPDIEDYSWVWVEGESGERRHGGRLLRQKGRSERSGSLSVSRRNCEARVGPTMPQQWQAVLPLHLADLSRRSGGRCNWRKSVLVL